MTANQCRALFLASLLALTLLRLVVAGTAPLAPDEAYYWVFSRALAPGYLDHPPMVALWIRAGTEIAGQGALGVRLLGPLAGALGSLLLFDAAEHLFPATHPLPPRAGVAAAVLLNGTLLAGVGAVIMTPDTPLLFFWTACLWALARLVRSHRPAWWLAIGLFAGLALTSKYTALLLWVGIGLWLVWVPSLRRWWSSPALWAGVLLGALTFLPVVLWNADHGWASFLRQGGRVDAWRPARAAQFLGELVGGQIGLATPLLFLLFIVGIGYATRRAWRDRDPAWSLLAALTLPGAALFVQHALGDRVQGNWPAVLYPAASIAAAGLRGRPWLRLRLPATALGLAITLVVYGRATGAVPAPWPGIDPIERQLAGWNGLAAQVASASQAQATDFVAVEEYGVAAELGRGLPAGMVMLGVAPRWRLFCLPSAMVGGAAGILLRGAGSGAPVGWRDAALIGSAERSGQGVAIQRFQLWRVAGPSPDLPAVVLPRGKEERLRAPP